MYQRFKHPQISIYDKAMASKSEHYMNTASDVYGDALATWLIQHIYYNYFQLSSELQKKIGGHLSRLDYGIYSERGLTYRKDIHFTEAFHIIDALSNAEQQKDFELTIEHFQFYQGLGHWVRRETDIKMNRVQMIERLEWISGQDFGDDIHQWRRWFMLKTKEDIINGYKWEPKRLYYYDPNYWDFS